MMIAEPRKEMSQMKEVKVKIPVGHHIKLHSMKVLTGKQISDAVVEALDVYFRSRASEFNASLAAAEAAMTDTVTVG